MALLDWDWLYPSSLSDLGRQICVSQCTATAEEQQLKAYAKEVAKLWRAPGTRVQERKRIARCLLEKIVVLAAPEAERLKAEVYWKGGEKTGLEAARDK